MLTEEWKAAQNKRLKHLSDEALQREIDTLQPVIEEFNKASKHASIYGSKAPEKPMEIAEAEHIATHAQVLLMDRQNERFANGEISVG